MLASSGIAQLAPRRHPCRTLGSFVGSAVLCMLACAQVNADLDDTLTARWYQTEIIVFERPAIDHTNTAEELTSQVPDKQPAELASFRHGGAPQYELRPRTKRMLRAGRIQPDTSSWVEATQAPLTSIPEFLVAEPPPDNSKTNAQPNALTNDPANSSATPLDPMQSFTQLVSDYEQHLLNYSYRFIADQTPRLQEVFDKLSPRRGYKVVWRGHWLQPVPDRKSPEPLLVQAGQRFDDRFQLEGSVALTVSRYLHLNLKLWYYHPDWRYLPVVGPDFGEPAATVGLNTDTQPNDLLPPTAPVPEMVLGPKVYMHLEANARMRSAELHYLDHPKFGVLVRVDPVTPPANLVAWDKATADLNQPLR